MDIECTDYDAKEFLSASFPSKNEHQNLITLCGAPDWFLLLWDIENISVLSKINIGIQGFTAQINMKGGAADREPNHNLMCSYNPFDSERVVVTGEDTFKVYKIEDGQFDTVLTLITGNDREITTRYTCHAWTHDGELIVATELGEIIVLDNYGQYLGFVS